MKGLSTFSSYIKFPSLTMVGILLGLGTHGILLSGLVAVQRDKEKSEQSQCMSLN